MLALILETKGTYNVAGCVFRIVESFQHQQYNYSRNQ